VVRRHKRLVQRHKSGIGVELRQIVEVFESEMRHVDTFRSALDGFQNFGI